jgi:hypothetical protein
VVVILNEPPPEPLLPLLEDVELLPEDELLRPPLEDVDPLLLPDEDELLLVAPEDDEPTPLDELPPLELELEVELVLVMASLLPPLPPLQAATVRQQIAAISLSSTVEWRMRSVLIQRATRSRTVIVSINCADRCRVGATGFPGLQSHFALTCDRLYARLLQRIRKGRGSAIER